MSGELHCPLAYDLISNASYGYEGLARSHTSDRCHALLNPIFTTRDSTKALQVLFHQHATAQLRHRVFWKPSTDLRRLHHRALSYYHSECFAIATFDVIPNSIQQLTLWTCHVLCKNISPLQTVTACWTTLLLRCSFYLCSHSISSIYALPHESFEHFGC
ncbi:hypothetical protein BDW22DRAFT_846055 [Trametopsis cervina]|nr:hypothetical protein BDW22DRAFT_846055 [Trametopsis cervina]